MGRGIPEPDTLAPIPSGIRFCKLLHWRKL
jgi:hypothetical protein